MKHKVAELEGALLDAAVAMAEGDDQWPDNKVPLPYSTTWTLGGPLIERERISLMFDCENWTAAIDPLNSATEWAPYVDADGNTPLVAAMRLYVKSKFGDEIELP